MVVVPAERVGKWYKEVFKSLDTLVPIEIRRAMTVKIVRSRMDAYERTVPLTTFLKKSIQ